MELELELELGVAVEYRQGPGGTAVVVCKWRADLEEQFKRAHDGTTEGRESKSRQGTNFQERDGHTAIGGRRGGREKERKEEKINPAQVRSGQVR